MHLNTGGIMQRHEKGEGRGWGQLCIDTHVCESVCTSLPPLPGWTRRGACPPHHSLRLSKPFGFYYFFPTQDLPFSPPLSLILPAQFCGSIYISVLVIVYIDRWTFVVVVAMCYTTVSLPRLESRRKRTVGGLVGCERKPKMNDKDQLHSSSTRQRSRDASL